VDATLAGLGPSGRREVEVGEGGKATKNSGRPAWNGATATGAGLGCLGLLVAVLAMAMGLMDCGG